MSEVTADIRVASQACENNLLVSANFIEETCEDFLFQAGSDVLLELVCMSATGTMDTSSD